jgi:CheY-like chemotaxis protein
MNLKTLLLSSDDRTVRVLRRVLSDLEIDVEHCTSADAAIRRITRQRFEAIIVDGAHAEDAGRTLTAAKAAPVNKRALAIVLVEASLGLKGGFDLGAHFVLHKPFAVERAKASFRAVRALMKRERRMQMRLPIEIPVDCYGNVRYKATTLDLCEGGMAVQFAGSVPKENSLRFSLDLPGSKQTLEISGEVAWGGSRDQAGVRFKDPSDDQRNILRAWLGSQLPELDQDDPPVKCNLSDLSVGGCYLNTDSPFPRGTRVVLSVKNGGCNSHASGVVLVAHPEFGMGIEFIRGTSEQSDQAQQMISILHANEKKHPEVLVTPDGMEPPCADDNLATMQTSATGASGTSDALVDLFRQKFEVPVESFLQTMREQRQALDSR